MWRKNQTMSKNRHELMWIIRHSRIVFIPLLIITIISAATSIFSVAFALISKDVIDTATGDNPSSLFSKCIIMIAAVLLQLAFQSISSILNTNATINLDHHLKLHLYSQILKKDWIKISTFHTGDLMSRMTSDVNHITNGVMGIIPSIIYLITQLLTSFLVLFSLDPMFTLIILAAGPIVVLFGNYFSKKVKKIHVACQESESKSRSFLQEALQNLMLTKAFSNEIFSTTRYRTSLDHNRKLQIKRNLFGLFSGVGLSLGFWLGYVFAIAWGSYKLTTGQITFGTMAAFLQLANQIQNPFVGLTRSFPRIYTTLASAGRLIDIENLVDEAPSIPVLPCHKTIEKLTFINTTFSYADENVLNQISFELKKGELAILEGASGEGKSTILRILLGLITPNNGDVFLTDENGEKLKIDNNTRSYFTYVPQGNSVFSGTIEENIRYGMPDAKPEEIWECVQTACLSDFMMELPDKLNTVIGERGTGISEGQAQRIAIARALLRKSPILLMDEATSALDETTEVALLKNLRNHLHDRICIFVSHRSSVNNLCDKSFLLENGNLYEKTRIKPPARAAVNE